jgi:hypothetical protein
MMISIPLSSPATISPLLVPKATLSRVMVLLTGTEKVPTVDRTSQLPIPYRLRFIAN